MDVTWVNVADSAIKIGLGALITAVSGFVVLSKTQSHEKTKEGSALFYKQQDERKSKYVEFLSASQSLIYQHILYKCTFDTKEYFEYLRKYNEVQIISPDHIQIEASKLFDSVNNFVSLNKQSGRDDLILEHRNICNVNLVSFQKLAQKDSTKSYAKT
ncbi:hypothetical protein SIN8267_01405 [Sinobacterium norvegicum]|uniref:Uncharacterized protein n=1 Tax=Sinobacterium norvegicum TaxID=1641715 RepID=A0ABN8EG36_9GAMM|nr:hypothetical protein [Sinobacterium norvegicum]CAH0991303.1 hypothetical protein SIN8267_01405 [Sinobacterium norvegicum]